MTDTFTQKMTAVYEKEFTARLETELRQPIKNIINSTQLSKELLKYTDTVSCANEVCAYLYAHPQVEQMLELYITKRFAEAVKFINNGAQNS